MLGRADLRRTLTGVVFRAVGEARFEQLRARYVAWKIRSGRYRPDEVDLLEHVVVPGTAAIDVGANFGAYTYHLARAVGASGRVYAFEPVPATCRALRRVLRILGVAGRVEVVEKAAGNRVGAALFEVPRLANGTAETARAAAVPDHERATLRPDRIDVRVTRIDDELPADADVSFIKVDAEGADLLVLEGATALIKRHAPTVLVEVAPGLLRRNGRSSADMDRFLRGMGYATFRYDGREGQLLSAAAAETIGDVLAVHPTRAAAVSSLVTGPGLPATDAPSADR